MQSDKPDIYLTPELKEYYSNDFIENVLPITNEFWRIHPKIVNSLISLNNNPKLQPLYSCYPDKPSQQTGYFEFTYVEGIEKDILESVLPALDSLFNIELRPDYIPKSEEYFTYEKRMPRENANYNGHESTYQIGCMINPDYFRVNTFKIVLEDGYSRQQDRLWQEITERLNAL